MRTGKVHLFAALTVTAGIIVCIVSVPLTRLTPLSAFALTFLTFKAAIQWKKVIDCHSSGNRSVSFYLRVASTVSMPFLNYGDRVFH